MATILPSACSFLMTSILSSGLHSAIKPSTPASLAIVAAVSGIVTGAHNGLNADGAQALKPLHHAGFHSVFQIDNTQNSVVFTDRQRRTARLEILSTCSCRSAGIVPPIDFTYCSMASAAPFRTLCRRADPHRSSGLRSKFNICSARRRPGSYRPDAGQAPMWTCPLGYRHASCQGAARSGSVAAGSASHGEKKSAARRLP